MTGRDVFVALSRKYMKNLHDILIMKLNLILPTP